MAESIRGLLAQHRPTRSMLGWTIGALAIFAILTVTSVHAFSGNSDGATVILEGNSIAHGNFLLHGWVLSQDSFWTIDAALYGLFVLLFGVNGALLHLVPALIATSIVLVGCHLAIRTNPLANRRVAYCIVVLGIVFPVAAWAQFLLAGPYHLGTTLYCLVAFALVTGTTTVRGHVVAGLILTAGMLGDLQTLSLGIVPIALAGVVAILRARSIRVGLGRVLVALFAPLLFYIVRTITVALGAFTLAPARTPSTVSGAMHNLWPGLRFGANLLGGGNGPFGTSPIPSALLAAHVVELIVIAVVVLWIFLQLLRGLVLKEPENDARSWELDDLLLLAMLGSLATYAYLATTGSDAEARYLSGAVIFAVILTARTLGRMSRALRVSRRPVLAFGGLIALAIVIGGGYTATAPAPPQPVNALIALLHEHQLTNGLGGYWTASITTVLSDDKIQVRPVISGPSGVIERYARQSLDTWYTGPGAQFLVYNANVDIDQITPATARSTFGPTSHVYVVGPYRVLVYPHRIHVGTNGYAM